MEVQFQSDSDSIRLSALRLKWTSYRHIQDIGRLMQHHFEKCLNM